MFGGLQHTRLEEVDLTLPTCFLHIQVTDQKEWNELSAELKQGQRGFVLVRK